MKIPLSTYKYHKRHDDVFYLFLLHKTFTVDEVILHFFRCFMLSHIQIIFTIMCVVRALMYVYFVFSANGTEFLNQANGAPGNASNKYCINRKIC